jgi:Chromatin remodeling factor Mit1 C-terminal Zn finger 2
VHSDVEDDEFRAEFAEESDQSEEEDLDAAQIAADTAQLRENRKPESKSQYEQEWMLRHPEQTGMVSSAIQRRQEGRPHEGTNASPRTPIKIRVPSRYPLTPTATSSNHPSRTPRSKKIQQSAQGSPSGIRQSHTIQRPPQPSNPIRAKVPWPPADKSPINCVVCSSQHVPGKCPLREVQVENCPGCGYSHLHLNRTCPLLRDAKTVEAMYQRLKESTEDPEIIQAAKTYLIGVKGDFSRRQSAAKKAKRVEI